MAPYLTQITIKHLQQFWEFSTCPSTLYGTHSMSSRVAKGHTSIPYPHQFKQWVLLTDTISGISPMVDSIAATTHPHFISGTPVLIRILTLLLPLYVGIGLPFHFVNFCGVWDHIFLVVNLTSTAPYFQPRPTNVTVSVPVSKRQLNPVRGNHLCVVYYSFTSSVFHFFLPIFQKPPHKIWWFQPVERSPLPNSTPVLFTLQRLLHK